jgi:hypothetical protein
MLPRQRTIKVAVIRKTRLSLVSGSGPLARCYDIGVRPTWPHWLALAGMAAFFTRKSHAAIYVASNHLICKQSPQASDIFDSHHPLHTPLPQQPAQAIVKRLLGLLLAAFECSSSRPKPEVVSISQVTAE